MSIKNILLQWIGLRPNKTGQDYEMWHAILDIQAWQFVNSRNGKLRGRTARLVGIDIGCHIKAISVKVVHNDGVQIDVTFVGTGTASALIACGDRDWSALIVLIRLAIKYNRTDKSVSLDRDTKDVSVPVLGDSEQTIAINECTLYIVVSIKGSNLSNTND